MTDESARAAYTRAWPLICSVCGADLDEGGGVLVCPGGHSFDRAREGYVNLLDTRDRERGIEGDTTDMLLARRRFLEAGHYRPLLDRLTREVDAQLQREPHGTRDRRCVLEAGCGEGYYIGSVANTLVARGAGTQFIGADVSKAAARLAAKQYRSTLFMVANVRRRLYVQSASADVLLSIFAPRNPGEFARVTAPRGCVLIVIPGPSHLAGLRERLPLIGVEQDKESRILEQFGSVFTLDGRESVDYSFRLGVDGVRDVVHMGPSHHHASALDTEVGRGIGEAEASFVVLRLRRNGRG